MPSHSESTLSLPFSDEDLGVLSVSQLTGKLRHLLEDRFAKVRVKGEVSNFSRAASGHCYFTLKDEDAQIQCVLWCWQADKLSFDPADGMLVEAGGEVSLYERRGDLQIKVDTLELAGEGALQKAFEALKRKLDGEGLFDGKHKRDLPAFPSAIGVVTSGAGAALHDITSTLERRYPSVEVFLCPVKVQGPGAGEGIARAIRHFSTRETIPDVLIVGRGGGSAEDLWAFNEECVARAIFASEIPIVSAVGHETDFSIADFTADRRAATPSIAAELVVPDRRELLDQVRTLRIGLHKNITARCSAYQQRLDYLTRSYGLRRAEDLLGEARQQLERLTGMLQQRTARAVTDERARLSALHQRLQLLDPNRPLERGYARVERNGQSVQRAAELENGQRIQLLFQDGQLPARIEA